MVEFCEKCGGMMLPSKVKDKKILVCNSCAQTKSLEGDFIDSYIFNKEICHPTGEEFKNLEKMKDWKNSKEK